MRRKAVARRARRRRDPLPAVLALGACVVLLLGGLTWARGIVLPVLVRTATAEEGAIEKSFEADAAVIRKETVYVAALSGRIRFLVGEGERVRTGTPIVEITNPGARKAAEERLAEVDARLADFEREHGAALQDLRRQLSSIDSSISTVARGARRAYSAGDRAAIAQAESDLAALMDRRAAIDREMESLDQRKRDIEREREGIRALLESASNTVESESPGIVSFLFDGCEKEFAWTRVRDLTARTVFLAQPEVVNATDMQEVTAGRPVFRVIQTDQAFLAAAFPSNRVTELGGATVRVRIPELGDGSVTTRVARLDTGPPGGYALAMLEMDGLPEQLLAARKIRMSIVSRSTPGVIIPESAVTTRDGRTGVFVVFKTMAQWKPVQVKARDGGRAVVDGLLPGTEVVVNPWLVREGRQVK